MVDDRMCAEGALNLLVLKASARKVDATKRPTDTMKLEETILEFLRQGNFKSTSREGNYRDTVAKVTRLLVSLNRLVTSLLEDRSVYATGRNDLVVPTFFFRFDFVYFFNSDSRHR